MKMPNLPNLHRATGTRALQVGSARPGSTLPAGKALLVIVLALLLAMLFNSRAMVHAGEGMRPGPRRGLVLGVARPVNTVAHTLRLDRPRKALDVAFGHTAAPSGPSELTGAATTPDGRAGQHAMAAGQAVAAPSPPPLAPLRQPSTGAPLNLLVTGDSMAEDLGPALLEQAGTAGKARGETDAKVGTGLVRPDYFDWSSHAREQMRDRNPEAVVVMMGGNETQEITLGDGRQLTDGSEEWVQEYRRRLEVVMRIYAGESKRRVYWVTMPVARRAAVTHDFQLINQDIVAAAGQVPGVTVVDIVGRLSNSGQYADYLPDDSGRQVLVRARDGVHLSEAGARIAAGLVLQALDADWHVVNNGSSLHRVGHEG